MPIQFVGIPFDVNSSFLRGPALAPDVIRSTFFNGASNFCTEDGSDLGVPGILIDSGNITVSRYAEIEPLIKKILPDGKLISLGGDHSISYPVINAHNKEYGPFDVLHIDAHADLYDSYEDNPWSHACPFARILGDGLIKRLVQVGIRTLNQHQREQAAKYNVEIIEMKAIGSFKNLSFNNPVYISVDLDAVDPAFAPGVSHHEPGGLTTRELLAIIQSIHARVIGADIVEFNPLRDHQNITGALAAKILKEIAAKMLSNG
ncbi:MAG TPA: agmatinase [Chitinophagaceae bacterium]|jgi:agmatinase|nr:agmatinase [Chitinophagaceae bacterium]